MFICIILAILFPLAAAASIFMAAKHYSRASSYNSYGRTRTEQDLKTKKTSKTSGMLFTILAIVFILLFIILPWNFRTVDNGEIAVVKNFGKVVDVREPGIHSDFWMTNSYVKLDTKVRQVDITTAAYSYDKQTMDIQMTVQYQIRKDMAKEIVINYGTLEMLEARIQSIAIERTKSILSLENAESIIQKRGTISISVAEVVEEALGVNYYVDITNISLTNIDFSDAFEQSVEQTMIAEQEVKRAEAEANKSITIARAEADVIKIKSLEVARMLGLTVVVGETETIKPNLTAEESKLISDYLKYMEYLSKWNGVLPGVMTDSGSIMIPVP